MHTRMYIYMYTYKSICTNLCGYSWWGEQGGDLVHFSSSSPCIIPGPTDECWGRGHRAQPWQIRLCSAAVASNFGWFHRTLEHRAAAGVLSLLGPESSELKAAFWPTL